ncbi:MAG: class I SAM-dependent methyltransferase [Chloroflexota bacterium]|nr:hypothetical protein [Dehalococcoidia bacterium]MDW8253196.1 class I SAM-dependent methyltransferase [Chloroflexota bacterium]
MVDRLLRWGLVGDGREAAIVAIDEDEEAVARGTRLFAPRRADLAARGVTVTFLRQSLEEAARTAPGAFDLVLAHHTLDLLNLSTAVPQLQALGAPDAVFWFTLTFDGRTRWTPVIEPRLDREIEARYHASMDSRDGTVHSAAGRRLGSAIQAFGGRVARSGASWWRITPQPEGYREEERVVLEAMLAFHQAALAGAPPSDRIEAWLRERKRQLAAGQLGLAVRHRDAAGWLFDPSASLQSRSARSAEASSL